MTRFSDEPREPWDRQPKETDAAWRAFQVYRDLPYDKDGPGTRSQREVCARLYPRRSPGPSDAPRGRKEVARWASKNRWVERCNAYDVHVDRLEQEVFRKALRQDIEHNITSYRAMRNKGNRAILALEPDAIRAGDAVRMVDTAITGLRREAGLATEITGTDDGDAFVTWLTGGADPDDEEDTDASA